MTVGELRDRMGMDEMVMWSRYHALRHQRRELADKHGSG